HLRRFGEKIMAPELWHLNRKSVSAAVAIGLFLAFIPMPAQMLVAAIFAIWLRVNLPIAVMSVWITNPLTMAPIFFFSYKIGAMILDVPLRTHEFAFSLEWLWEELGFIWQPFLLGSVICGVLAAVLGVIVVRLIWRLVVIHSWLKRYRRQKARRDNDSNQP
ncbi:MAG: DUF2062 domain-containing protein, partial [Methylophaga nitratireducenticrescens]